MKGAVMSRTPIGVRELAIRYKPLRVALPVNGDVGTPRAAAHLAAAVLAGLTVEQVIALHVNTKQKLIGGQQRPFFVAGLTRCLTLPVADDRSTPILRPVPSFSSLKWKTESVIGKTKASSRPRDRGNVRDEYRQLSGLHLLPIPRPRLQDFTW
jgi:hypothetical protein